MNKKNITILLATYNGEEWITKQLESIENQIAKNIKIIVSDDQSTDETLKKIISFKKKSLIPIEFLQSKNKILSSKGHCNNFLKLILDSKISPDSEWVAFCDQDDIWLSDKLSNAVNFLENNPKYGGWSSAATAFWNNKIKYIPKSGYIHKYNHLFESAGPGCTYVLSKEAFLSLKNTLKKNLIILPNIEFADWAIYSIVKSNNFLWHIEKKSSILYRQHSKNAIGIANNITSYIDRFRKLINGWYRSQVCLLSVINNSNKINLIKRIIRLSILDRLVLFFLSFYLRRKIKDKLTLAVSFLFMKRTKLPKFLLQKNIK